MHPSLVLDSAKLNHSAFAPHFIISVVLELFCKTSESFQVMPADDAAVSSIAAAG